MTEQYHPEATTRKFVDVLLPLAVPNTYTYYLPDDVGDVTWGVRVEVPVRKKFYAGIVVRLHDEAPSYDTKPVSSVIDTQPILLPEQWSFWQWLADYYCCTPGEVMIAALPSLLKLTSETTLIPNPTFGDDFTALDDREYLIAEALTMQPELSIDDAQLILQRKNVFPVIRSLLDKGAIALKEELIEKYKPKVQTCIRLAEPYSAIMTQLAEAFELVKRSDKQTSALMALVQLTKNQTIVTVKAIYEKTNVNSSVLSALEKKGIVEIFSREISRIAGYEDDTILASELDAQQIRAIEELGEVLRTRTTALLHGVTGSGKTRVYVELIQRALAKGGQVLYLLPEIALTVQVIQRLQRIFGDDIVVYHSRLNHHERVELWNMALAGKKVILGVRSALFLPFRNLRLVILDEEHDSSFKQADPNPRYNARDAAIWLATKYGAKVILGTATPAVETYQNALTEKFGLVRMNQRFGGLELPEIIMADIRAEMKQRKMQAHFTSVLLDAMKETLGRGEQVILFQNRRGFAPVVACHTCGWTARCERCDVGLTYHKHTDKLDCHYCGYYIGKPSRCPACGSAEMGIKGLGTERIEDEIQIYFPEANIGRMDLDTTKSRHAHGRIISEFEDGRTQILVGTQMVTKGLDFDNVGLVGVINADAMLGYPDFRAAERTFQLLTQVAGRAGRKQKRGKVIIQTYQPTHPVLLDVLQNNYKSFFERELGERLEFQYPPYFRIIGVLLKHRDTSPLNEAARIFGDYLRQQLPNRVFGPAIPPVGRINNQYLLEFTLKLSRDPNLLRRTKLALREATALVQGRPGLSGTRVVIDVDPS